MFQDILRLHPGISYSLNIYDELFDSALDDTGIDKILNILRLKVEKYQESVYIISHKTSTKSNIDNTILYFDKDLNYFYSFIKENMENLNDENIINESIRLYNLYIDTNRPIPTDYQGFHKMSAKKNIQVIFLTSRHIHTKELTKIHFDNIGINYNNFIVHYTNYEITKLDKGDYLLSNNIIDFSNYEEIIFIDDSEFYLKSVNRIFPNIKCYKFVIK
jgi:hypothetical protein